MYSARRGLFVSLLVCVLAFIRLRLRYSKDRNRWQECCSDAGLFPAGMVVRYKHEFGRNQNYFGL